MEKKQHLFHIKFQKQTYEVTDFFTRNEMVKQGTEMWNFGLSKTWNVPAKQ